MPETKSKKVAESKMIRTIEIKGARSNNLKDLHVFIPKNQLVVVTGVSGSGKCVCNGNAINILSPSLIINMYVPLGKLAISIGVFESSCFIEVNFCP